MTEEKRVYTVTELTKDIRLVLENAFSGIWVEGEVSNLTAAASGHLYFSLKDENSLVNCVMFRSAGAKLPFTVENGMRVLCSGRVSVYDKRGQYQLYVNKIEPCGEGALHLAFEQLKKKLSKEGLFDEERKRSLPFLPMRVGVVTSPTGAAIRDILKVARRRFSNVEITLRPAKVQGKDAKDEIAKAIEELNEYNEHIAETGGKEHPIDVMIVGRGGGSLEDLWPFNEEKVARAIHASEIPVVSAVGHEIDYTISDFTADMRAPTPSAAAELVIPKRSELINMIKQCRQSMKTAIKTKIDTNETELTRLRKSYVMRAPINVFLQLKQQVDDLARTATSTLKHLLQIKRSELCTVTGKMDAMSPLAVLERGYSITFKKGRIVKSADTLKKGDVLKTQFAQGKADSEVKEVDRS